MHISEADFVAHIQKFTVQDYSALSGKRVLLRVDWNMPLKDGFVVDKTRALATLPFIKKLSNAGARIILLTHYGEKGESLEPIAKYIKEELPFITFTKDFNFENLKVKSESLNNGEGILIENVRMWDGETECLSSLSKSFASLGDVFINDAFSVSHRKHSSVVGVAEILESYLGPTCVNEVINLHEVLNPVLPALLIVGGSKMSTKLPLIDHYLKLGVSVFIGGAMVHNVWKDRGIEIGNSLYDKSYKTPESVLNNNLLFTPIDVILDNGESVKYTDIPKNRAVMDLGKESVDVIAKISSESKTIIMNGPLGLYEKGWLHGTENVLNVVAHSGASTYVGGGDTLTVAQSLHILDKFTFVSLGGGAMLDFLSSGTLVGIDAVTK